MYVIRLPDGTLRVPHSVLADSAAEPADDTDRGRVIAQGYVEIRPGEPGYDRLLPESITEGEMAAKRQAWRDGDEELLRVFEEYKAGTED